MSTDVSAIAYLAPDLDNERFEQKALAAKLSLEVTGIRQEGMAHPAQWTLCTTDNYELYARYRNGRLTVERARLCEEHDRIECLLIFGVQGYDVEPDMTTCAMLAFTGLRPTNDCEWDVQNL